MTTTQLLLTGRRCIWCCREHPDGRRFYNGRGDLLMVCPECVEDTATMVRESR